MASIPNTCDEMRTLIGQFLKRGDSEAQRLWDIITCQRGPDHPSEDGTMASVEAGKAYEARRKRKRDTVEVIRAQSWGGVVGGAARWRDDINYVTVERPEEQDHFARHVVKAANALGLEVRFKKPKADGAVIETKVKAADPTTKKVVNMMPKGVGIGGEFKSKIFPTPSAWFEQIPEWVWEWKNDKWLLEFGPSASLNDVKNAKSSYCFGGEGVYRVILPHLNFGMWADKAAFIKYDENGKSNVENPSFCKVLDETLWSKFKMTSYNEYVMLKKQKAEQEKVMKDQASTPYSVTMPGYQSSLANFINAKEATQCTTADPNPF